MRIKHFVPALLGTVLLCGIAVPTAHADDTWQYSVRVGQDPLRRAYLWVPPKTQRVRGVILGVQNMLEQLMFEDDTIRQAAADAGLAIVWLSPRDDFDDKNQRYRTFNPPKETEQGIEGILTALAKESGYSEIANAPLMVTAHSASTPFVYGIAATMPERMIAVFPYKGWIQNMTPDIPTLYTTSEYAEVGDDKWGETVKKDTAAAMAQRVKGDNFLVGEFVEVGNGHFEWNPEVAPVLGMFIRKAVQYRLPPVAPTDAPTNGPVQLKAVDPKSGWLIDPDKFGTPEGTPVAYADYKGDPTKALWYFDQEMASTINNYAISRLAKKPQVVDFLGDDGMPLSLEKGGNPSISSKIMDDGYTFKVAATFLDKAPSQIYGGAPVGHAPGAIQFKAGSGAIKQTGPDTFRVWMRRGGLVQQSSPWDPWIIAFHPGNDEYRRADRPGHPWVYTINRDGKAQFIDFAPIGDQKSGIKSIQLKATSDSGLPVQLYIVSGPVKLEDDNRTLDFLPIPSRSKMPVRVVLGAYQWGRITEPKIQTAGPLVQEFFIDNK